MDHLVLRVNVAQATLRYHRCSSYKPKERTSRGPALPSGIGFGSSRYSVGFQALDRRRCPGTLCRSDRQHVQHGACLCAGQGLTAFAGSEVSEDAAAVPSAKTKPCLSIVYLSG